MANYLILFTGASEPPPTPTATTYTRQNPTYHQSMGATVNMYEPLFVTSTPSLVRSITNAVTSYSQERRAMGGYWSAQITLKELDYYLDDWILNSLGRHIKTTSHYLDTIFEGFINQISVQYGKLQYTIGPLASVINSPKASYTPTDYSTSPSTRGSQTFSDVVTSAASIAKYGIWQGILNAGDVVSEAEAQAVLNRYLKEPVGPWPQTSQQVSTSSIGDYNVRLDCLGYWHLLGKYYVTDTSINTTNASAKIVNVLNSDPNGILSANTDLIETNTLQMGILEAGDRTGDTILMRINELGSSAGERTIMGITEGRKFYYATIPGALEYVHSVKGDGLVYNKNGANIITPPHIQSARWLLTSDMLLGEHNIDSISELQANPKAQFLEQVNFTAPYDASFSGEKFGTFDQFMAKMGLAVGGS